MEQQSPFLLMKQLEAQLGSVLAAIDVYSLPVSEARLIEVLRQEITDARLDARDYELSETRAEQLKNAKMAKRRLEKVRKYILEASEFNVFGSVDVALLSAKLAQIIDELK